MKREYTKPESKYVDITLQGTILEDAIDDDPTPSSVPLGNEGIWDDSYDKLPSAKSVWGDSKEEEEI
jgi:hypothetical protein